MLEVKYDHRGNVILINVMSLILIYLHSWVYQCFFKIIVKIKIKILCLPSGKLQGDKRLEHSGIFW